MSEVSSLFIQEFQGIQQDAAFSFHMNGLPQFSMTGSYIDTHTMCVHMHKNTLRRTPPLGIKSFLEQTPFIFSTSEMERKSVACRAHWQVFPSSTASKAAHSLPHMLMQQNHCMFMESLLAKHRPSNASWLELTKMKIKTFFAIFDQGWSQYYYWFMHLFFMVYYCLIVYWLLSARYQKYLKYLNYYASQQRHKQKPKVDMATPWANQVHQVEPDKFNQHQVEGN